MLRGENDKFFIFHSDININRITDELVLLIDPEVDTIIVGDIGNGVMISGNNSDPDVLASLIQRKNDRQQ
jgi:hypothetical protein